MNNNKETFTQLFIVLLGLFIFIFFTRWFYSDLIWNLDRNEQKNNTYKEKITELDIISKRQKELEVATGWWKETKKFLEIKRYLQPVTENEIINEIYSMAENRINGKVKILSLSMSEWVKNELGFMESKLNISAIVDNKNSMKQIFDYLNTKTKYKIFINSFNMPKQPGILWYRIQIPATIFYVESK